MDLNNPIVKEQVKQQLKILKENKAVSIVERKPEEKFAIVNFVFHPNLYGQVVLKGGYYDMFEELGGFSGV